MNNEKEKNYHIVSFISKYSVVAMVIVTLLIPVSFTMACDGPGEPRCAGVDNTTNKKTPAGVDNTKNSSGNVQVTTGIKNPLGDNLSDIPSFITAIINFILIIGVPIVALAIIYSGFLFVTAAGNSEKLTKAKKAFLYTLIGAALLLGSFVISRAIVGTVKDINSTT